jgi:aspartate racemase
MKTIGIIGGLTWLSTVEYYKYINQITNEKLGGVSSAKILLYSVNFEEIKSLTMADDWDGITAIVSNVAAMLEKAGADCLLLGANTMHKIAEQVQAAVSVPIIHIAKSTASVVKQNGVNKVALLGTRYTMQLPFYRDILQQRGIEILIPEQDGIVFINNAIYEEMGKGIFSNNTKERMLTIINELKKKGAQGVIMGCTEIPILLKNEQCGIPLFDTTFIHAAAAVDFALQHQAGFID